MVTTILGDGSRSNNALWCFVWVACFSKAPDFLIYGPKLSVWDFFLSWRLEASFLSNCRYPQLPSQCSYSPIQNHFQLFANIKLLTALRSPIDRWRWYLLQPIVKRIRLSRRTLPAYAWAALWPGILRDQNNFCREGREGSPWKGI